MSIPLWPLLPPEWQQVLNPQLFQPIEQHLADAQSNGQTILPASDHIFKAFHFTPIDQVKVVILGQDPYHQMGQAMGLSFSVPQSVKTPPSLKNIYKEIARTHAEFRMPDHGDLTSWAQQGVLLLNSTLTVAQGQANSHAKFGWQALTDHVIATLSEQRTGLIFMLWGNFAKSKAPFIDPSKHHILEAVHPSPLARGGFMGCNHFLQTNHILQQQGHTPINWQV